MSPEIQIPLLDLVAQYHSIQGEIAPAIQQVLLSGQFILGEEVSTLESEIAEYTGAPYAIGVASGTDALILALRAQEIGPGDEVILPAYTFFATAGAVLHVGATPVLVDIDPQTYCLDVDQVQGCLTGATRAIIPVHLYGHPAEMQSLLEIARREQIAVIEDNAQAFGATYYGHKTGSFGDLACLSFFPTKNLGGYGDGGMVLTRDPALADKIRMLRTHGWKKKYYPEILGYNSRLDALQAALLRVKLRHVDAWNERRRQLALEYSQAFAAADHIVPPYEAPGCHHVYHLYIVRLPERERIQQALKNAGIASAVYYPQPLHFSGPLRCLGHQPGDFPASEAASRETLAIPLYPEMSARQVQTVLSTMIQPLA